MSNTSVENFIMGVLHFQVTSTNVDYIAKAIHEAVTKFQKWQLSPSDTEPPPIDDDQKKMTKILTVEF